MKHLQRSALVVLMLISTIATGCGLTPNSVPAAGSVSSNQQTSVTTSTASSTTSLPQETVTTTSTSVTATTTITPTIVSPPTLTPTTVPPPTLIPTTAPTPAPTVVASAPKTSSTVTFDETFIKNALSTALAQRQTRFPITVTSVSLQNGQITINLTVTIPVGTLNGTVVADVTANNCALQGTIVSGTVGPRSLNETQKQRISAALDAAFARELARLGPNICVESVIVANGKMSVTYR